MFKKFSLPRLLGKKQKRLGFMEKKRTRAEVDTDYSQHALQLGHKSRVLAQIQSDAERVESEIRAHLTRLLELNQEGIRLPVPAQEKTNSAPIEANTAQPEAIQ